MFDGGRNSKSWISLSGFVCIRLSVVENLVPIPIHTPPPNSCVCHPWQWLGCLPNLNSSCSMNNTTCVTTLNFQTTLCPAPVTPDHLYLKIKHMEKLIYNYANIFRNKALLHKKIQPQYKIKDIWCILIVSILYCFIFWYYLWSIKLFHDPQISCNLHWTNKALMHGNIDQK